MPICKYGLPLIFLSTLSLRRATDSFRVVVGTGQHFYPRSPCGERPLPNISFITSILLISIHALLAESDANRAELNIRQIHFYPRSPCGERQFSYFLHIHRLLFLSTLSLRRATAQIAPFFRNNRNFYPRSPCGERRKIKDFVYLYNFISIHALLAESDGILVFCGPQGSGFLSTLSLRRATIKVIIREPAQKNFYPRSPCGERQSPEPETTPSEYFYPRSPCGERRTSVVSSAGTTGISIHALLAESDVNRAIDVVESRQFLSTLSLRRATE